jgi:magnesium transporter
MATRGIPDPNSREALLAQIRSALNDRIETLDPSLAEKHPADIADAIQAFEAEDLDRVLDLFTLETRADVVTRLADLDEELTGQFVEDQTVAELVEIVDEMDPDDAVDLLEVAGDAKAEAVIEQLEADDAEEIRELRRHDSDTAGGIMTTEYLAARPDETPPQIIERLKLESDDVETVQTMMICGEDDKLLGVIRAKALLTADPAQPVSTVMDRGVVQVVVSTDQEACANLMMKYDISVLPVVDEGNRLIGIITSDDIMDVVEDEAEEDMYRMAGVGDNEPLVHGAMVRAFRRLPWLATTLLGMGLICPLILHRWFEATLDQVVVLAFFIPAIMGLSGNTATQSATITVRGLATGEIDFGDLFWLIRRELAVATIIAVVCSAAMMVFAYGVTALGFESESAVFSLGRITATVGISMFAGIIVAVILGTSVPMLCHRLGVDPAVASGPFITTIIDISTQVIYLALATSLLLQ